MKNKYFFKLINGEKFQVSENIFNNYVYHMGGDFYTLKSPKATLIVQREQIILAYMLETENND